MKIVVDTNVLVSAFLTPHGPPGRLLEALLTGSLTLCFDDRILAEYHEVLTRPKFGFDPARVTAVLEYLEAEGQHVIALPLELALPDPDDRAFIEVTIAAEADWLVTGNVKHFPSTLRSKARLIEPAEFIRLLEE